MQKILPSKVSQAIGDTVRQVAANLIRMTRKRRERIGKKLVAFKADYLSSVVNSCNMDEALTTSPSLEN